MAENIYSNPNGFTAIPWQLSNGWFMGKFLEELRLVQAEMSKPTPSNTVCENCGWSMSSDKTRCPTCFMDRQVSQSDASEEVELIPEELLASIEGDPFALKELDQQELLHVHNLIVDCLRNACVRELSDGQVVEVRTGLRVSREWDAHFRNLHSANPQTMIWLATKHAMLGNPLDGEVFEWTNVSEGGPVSGPNRSGGAKIAGAGALGLLAGFLFG